MGRGISAWLANRGAASLAYAEMRLILARVLFNFDMELVDPNVDWLDHKSYVIWAKPPLNVYLKPVR